MTTSKYNVLCLYCRQYQIALCDIVMEHNRRTNILPIEGSDSSRNNDVGNPLHSFFPFDPYLLSE